MADEPKQVRPQTEQSKFEGIDHVNVDKTVELIKRQLQNHKRVQLISEKGQISRVGMIIKRVEEETKSKIVYMRTQNKQESKQDKEYNILYFKVLFEKTN